MPRPAPADAAPADGVASLAGELVALGGRLGLAAVGITDAAPFPGTRTDLRERRGLGLHAGMQFTYRNPDRSTDPGRLLPGARSLVVGAWGYQRADPDEGADDDRTTGGPPRATGRVARYARRDHYASLRDALAPLAERLRCEGWRATVVADDNGLVDRAAAHRAGLGWFGKNTLLLLPGLGSWFVLGSVVTDAPLVAPAGQSAPSPHGSGCGRCVRCLDACPTGALVAPGVLDAGRCLAWLVQAPGSIPEAYREALGDRIYGCDECQEACPINRTVDRRHPPGPAEPDTRDRVDLLALLAATDDELLAAHGRWYIAGRQPRYLRRNALVALGNTGDGDDPATERALRRALADPDPLLVEHAAWAARRLGRDDLVGRAA
jgi:epoxyqueuosine reductase